MSKVLRFSGFEEVYDYRITHENSQHSILYLKTRVLERNFPNTDCLVGSVINADVFEEEYEEELTKYIRSIFLGTIDKVWISFDNYAYCEIFAHSFSEIMDIEEKNRIFQNQKKTLLDILKTVTSYDGIVLKGDGIDSISIPTPIIQYKETDWQFLLRVCKQFGYKVSVSHDFDSEKEGTIWIGEIERKPIEINFNQIISKIYEGGCTYIIFQDENIYEVGDTVSFDNKNYSICSCIFFMENNAFVKEYKITDYVEKEILSLNLEGVVIPAKVVSLEGEGQCKGQIQVKFDWEEGISENMIWIDWLTSYSDSSVGIYNMPTIGENVLVTILDANGTSMFAHGCVRNSEIDQGIKVTDKIIRIGEKEIQIVDDVIRVKNKTSTVTIASDNLLIETENGNWRLTNGKSMIETDGERIRIDGTDVEIESTNVKIKGKKEILLSGKKTMIESSSIELIGTVEVK